ncbi:predicted protein [Naegleria gruberi]|uniref:Predicted protein n=1 Tax=Naegleria gruberi TaxID=5762 RepID=D2V9H4_NAEGR|nr:uncharacterized protein NAEGRDRAFT_36010 [Naegleria gruberi]EFC46459.1 predicted protein [Naegleria gruberi]|eukprot:XP_002679203.1 predicted protein [Naegleria gruberi strain NEG-M]
MEGKIENVYVLDSYKLYLEKYSYVVTFKDRIGHQTLYPSEIIENFLFLGNRDNASSDRELTDIGITYILNMAEEVENVLEEMILDNGEKKYKYLKLGTGDTIEHSISDLFEQANQFLREAFENNCKAIVNCNMGISRSSTTVLSYLMKYYELSFEEAFHHAKGHRSIVCPNQAFREQLKNYYKR